MKDAVNIYLELFASTPEQPESFCQGFAWMSGVGLSAPLPLGLSANPSEDAKARGDEILTTEGSCVVRCCDSVVTCW